MFVVTVEFEVYSNHVENFNRAMIHQAQTSLEREDDCHRFDVCRDPAATHRTFLYEVYTDRSAFDSSFGK